MPTHDYGCPGEALGPVSAYGRSGVSSRSKPPKAERITAAFTVASAELQLARHYFGSEAARWSSGNGVLVAALMGHENTNTTMGYIGWAPTEGAEVVAKITAAGAVDDELAARRRLASA